MTWAADDVRDEDGDGIQRRLPDDAGQVVITHAAAPNSESEAALRILANHVPAR